MRRLISVFLISAVLCITINALDVSDFSSHTDIQHFINTELAENAGVSAEWYVFALCKSGNYDFSKYISALDKYTLQITSYDVTSLKYALAFTACGVENEFTKNVCKQIGAQASVMYTVFSLHLLNNNQPAPVSATELCQRLISLQNEDGGWSVIKGKSDADVSAMVLQALAPHKSLYEENINKALAFLQNIQNENNDTIYILNTNTMKFHNEGCSSVKDIKPQNKETFNGTKAWLTDNGYSPCGVCNP